MKDKIIMLILGIFIGAILAGGCFWFATTITKDDTKDQIPDANSIDRDRTRWQRPEDANVVLPEENTVTE